MLKIVPMNQDVNLKTYWCSDLQVAEKVVRDLKRRYGQDWHIVDVPTKETWSSSHLLDAATCFPRRVRAFQLKPQVRFGCSQEQIEDAVKHVKDDVMKINDDSEIFCFEPTDLFWQKRYQYESH